MNRTQQSGTRQRINRTVRRTSYRPVDGVVFGDGRTRGSRQDVWVLMSRPGEGVMEFFLDDDEPSGVVAEPGTQVCLGVGSDGTITLGSLDWDRDRFLSEMIYDARRGEGASE
jgi:hypothetical protein